MRSLIKLIFIPIALISMSVHSKTDLVVEKSPIIFQLVGNDSVIVNGVKTTIKGSWREAMKYINPHENNTYKITNINDYLKQASDIEEYMAIVAKTSGVKVQLI
ncbi:hypothetical protein AADZ84_04070 [Colwelliaceae bacterium MEBiC 14330]